jgi:membrane-associated phospholipid phosphatase
MTDRSHAPANPERRDFLHRLARAALVAAGSDGVLARATRAGDDPSRPLARDFEATAAVEWMRLLIDRVRVERLSPPVAARVYAYAGVALHEAVAGGMPDGLSLAGHLRDLPPIPSAAGSSGHWAASAAAALAVAAAGTVPWALTSTRAAFDQLLRDQRARFRADGLGPGRVEDSFAHGAAIGRAIVDWAASDGFAATRGRAYTPPVGPEQWVPTPPAFVAPLEPYWGTLRPFTLAAPDACPAGIPAAYSPDRGSDFSRQAQRVHEAMKALRTEHLEIARFWADDPGQTGTPAGHWVSIGGQLVMERGLRLDTAGQMYALVGTALGDAFIACWHAKYRANVLRPITYIRRHIEPRWGALLMTPPFPEYPSGHSVASAAAAEVLTALFGPVALTDRTHDARRLRPRSFDSFHAAAAEAALSRLYGGIHYPMAIEDGLAQGRCIGRRVSALVARRSAHLTHSAEHC